MAGSSSRSTAPPKIHPLLDEIPQTLSQEFPALLGQLLRLTAGQQLMQHRVKPVGHGADQGDQRFRIGGIQLIPSGDASQGVVATPLPKLNAIGELLLKP